MTKRVTVTIDQEDEPLLVLVFPATMDGVQAKVTFPPVVPRLPLLDPVACWTGPMSWELSLKATPVDGRYYTQTRIER